MAEEQECIGNGNAGISSAIGQECLSDRGFPIIASTCVREDRMPRRCNASMDEPRLLAASFSGSIPKEVPRIGLEMSFGPIKMLLPLFKTQRNSIYS